MLYKMLTKQPMLDKAISWIGTKHAHKSSLNASDYRNIMLHQATLIEMRSSRKMREMEIRCHK